MKRLAVLLAAAWLLAAPIPVLAFTPRAGDAVVVTETITDDLYAAGGTVEVSGTVDGDVVAAGGSVTLSGPVSGSVLAGGGNVHVSGAVGRSLRAGAGTLRLGGRVATDALLAGGSVEVQREAEVGRDLLATGGSLRITGAVGRNAFLSGGTVIIGGRIEGEVTVEADRLTVLSSARVVRAGAEPSPYLAQIVGTLLLVLLIAVPFLGWVVRLVAVLLGVGTVWAGIWATRQRPAPAAS